MLRYVSPVLAQPVPVRRDARTGATNDGGVQDAFDALPPWWKALSMAGGAIGAYHGYKRNDSVGWAIGWGLFGTMFPIIVIPVAFAQGIDKRG